jgi:hypothetical protein
MRPLPKHILYSPRNGKYTNKHDNSSNYFTFSQQKVLALLLCENSDDRPRWTAKTLGKAAGLSEQRCLQFLTRCKKEQKAEWAKDEQGRNAWIITDIGAQYLLHQCRFRYCFRLPKKKMMGEFLLDLINRAEHVKDTLKGLGWKDTQSRDMLLRVDLWRIESAIAKYYRRKHVVEKPGAFIMADIIGGNKDYTRSKAYVDAAAPHFSPEVREKIADLAVKTTTPLTAARSMASSMWGKVKSRHPGAVQVAAVHEVFEELRREKQFTTKADKRLMSVVG